jgi:hypothetical protein
LEHWPTVKILLPGERAMDSVAHGGGEANFFAIEAQKSDDCDRS